MDRHTVVVKCYPDGKLEVSIRPTLPHEIESCTKKTKYWTIYFEIFDSLAQAQSFYNKFQN